MLNVSSASAVNSTYLANVSANTAARLTNPPQPPHHTSVHDLHSKMHVLLMTRQSLPLHLAPCKVKKPPRYASVHDLHSKPHALLVTRQGRPLHLAPWNVKISL